MGNWRSQVCFGIESVFWAHGFQTHRQQTDHHVGRLPEFWILRHSPECPRTKAWEQGNKSVGVGKLLGVLGTS